MVEGKIGSPDRLEPRPGQLAGKEIATMVPIEAGAPSRALRFQLCHSALRPKACLREHTPQWRPVRSQDRAIRRPKAAAC